jgi:hypothetical protein
MLLITELAKLIHFLFCFLIHSKFHCLNLVPHSNLDNSFSVNLCSGVEKLLHPTSPIKYQSFSKLTICPQSKNLKFLSVLVFEAIKLKNLSHAAEVCGLAFLNFVLSNGVTLLLSASQKNSWLPKVQYPLIPNLSISLTNLSVLR